MKKLAIRSRAIIPLMTQNGILLSLLLKASQAWGVFYDSPSAAYKPRHGGYPSLVRLDYLPDDTKYEVFLFLDERSQMQLANTSRENLNWVKRIREIQLKKELIRELKKLKMLTLPEIQAADVEGLRDSGVPTSIQEPLPAFQVSETRVPIGLYHAVMGRYPTLKETSLRLDLQKKVSIRERWRTQPDLPLTYTTLAEDQEFVARLNELTGSHFFIPSEAQVEYAIRGRHSQDQDCRGQINCSFYFFGNETSEAHQRIWVSTNSGGSIHGVREPIANQSIENSKNCFGLIHPTGNVEVRSSNGAIRGGSALSYAWGAGSSSRKGGYATQKLPTVGLLLAHEAVSEEEL